MLGTDLSFKEIADKIGVGYYSVADINTGKTFYQKELKYPLRKQNLDNFYGTEEDVKTIVSLLKNTDMPFSEISEKMNCSVDFIGYINRGERKICPKGEKYPIRKSIKDNTYSNKLEYKDVKNIVYDLIFTKMKLSDIGNKYEVAKNTIIDISRGITWKEATKYLEYPLRRNSEINQKLFNKHYK